MKKFLLLSTILFAPTLAFAAANGPSSSPRVQGVPDGFGNPVQVTIVGPDGDDASLSVSITGGATEVKQDTQITAAQLTNTTLGAVTASPTANTIGDRLKTINTTLGTPLQAGGNVVVTSAPTTAVTGTFWQATQPVSGTVTAKSERLEYETVAASQSAQAMGATGATGDYLSHCIIQPVTTAAGTVTIADNSTTVVLFTTGTLSDLRPITIPVGANSVSGAWKITTGANETVACFGDFT